MAALTSYVRYRYPSCEAGLWRMSGLRQLQQPLSSLLINHLRRYVNVSNATAPPFEYKKCISSSDVLQEPLGLLLKAVLRFVGARHGTWDLL